MKIALAFWIIFNKSNKSDLWTVNVGRIYGNFNNFIYLMWIDGKKMCLGLKTYINIKTDIQSEETQQFVFQNISKTDGSLSEGSTQLMVDLWDD